jgi:radical SAM protein with 4Fe4S-binding SPASM domain
VLCVAQKGVEAIEVLRAPEFQGDECDDLFRCGAGNDLFCVGYDGTFRLCNTLWHPNTTYRLSQGALRKAWEEWAPRVRSGRGTNSAFLDRCRRCAIADLCIRCRARGALETGSMDDWVEYFRALAHAREAALGPVDPEESLAVEPP